MLWELKDHDKVMNDADELYKAFHEKIKNDGSVNCQAAIVVGVKIISTSLAVLVHKNGDLLDAMSIVTSMIAKGTLNGLRTLAGLEKSN